MSRHFNYLRSASDGVIDWRCRYQKELEGLYTALEERLRERLRAMKEGKDASVQDRIKQVTCSLSAIKQHPIAVLM